MVTIPVVQTKKKKKKLYKYNNNMSERQSETRMFATGFAIKGKIQYEARMELRITDRRGGRNTVTYPKHRWRCDEIFIDRDEWEISELRIRTRESDDENAPGNERVLKVDELWFRNRECLEDLFTQLGVPRQMWSKNEVRRTRVLREAVKTAAERDQFEEDSNSDGERNEVRIQERQRIVDAVLSDDSDVLGDLSDQEEQARQAGDLLPSDEEDDVKPVAVKRSRSYAVHDPPAKKKRRN